MFSASLIRFFIISMVDADVVVGATVGPVVSAVVSFVAAAAVGALEEAAIVELSS